MIFSILVRVVHASNDYIKETIQALPQLEKIFNLSAVLASIDFSKKIEIIDIAIGLWVVWMARNLFFYLQKGLTRIFKKMAKSRPVLNQILIFAGEIILVVAAAALVFISLSLKTVKRLPLLDDIASLFSSALLNSIFKTANILPYIALFAAVFMAYKFYTGTKPSLRLCLLSAALCALSFLVAATFLNFFLNFERFNLIYGILGNLVILLFEVKIFFILFYAFAQFIYVSQFFPALLEKYQDKQKKNKIETLLFGKAATVEEDSAI